MRNNQDFPGRRCPVYSGRTASGAYVAVGMAAADWNVFPKNTRIRVPGFPHHGGIVKVTDTGGMIIGKHIDLAVSSCFEALNFGARRELIAYQS